MRALILAAAFCLVAGPAAAQISFDTGTFSGTTTTLIGTTSVCSIGAQETADSVCLTSDAIVFEGDTADDFETTITVTDPTADRTITFPNNSLTVAGFDVAQSWTAVQTFNDTIALAFGTGADSRMLYSTTATPDTTYITAGTDSRAIHIVEQGDAGFDFNNCAAGTSAATNPQFCIHSANQATDEFGAFDHDQTDFNLHLSTGSDFLVKDASGNNSVKATSAGQVILQSDGGLYWTSSTTDANAATNTAILRQASEVLRVQDNVSQIAYLQYGQVIEANTGSKAPNGNTEYGECYTNTGDTDGSDITLPDDPAVGYHICVFVTAAQTLTIAPNTGESLYMDADQCVVDMTASSIGANTKITAATAGSGAIWIATGHGFTCNDS